jgi:ADP-dependent NAD(P)H-hydrate dehydratase / NAD(P)H-hydrate epimerase
MNLKTDEFYSKDCILKQEKNWFLKDPLAADKLIEKAGLCVWKTATSLWPKNRSWLVACGSGNNAADGLVFALHAHQNKHHVTLFCLDLHSKSKPLAKLLAQARDQGLSIATLTDPIPSIKSVWVDALFGIGLNRPIDGSTASFINSINHSQLPILSIDIPSGLDPDTGTAHGACIKATHTLTMMVYKPGLFMEWGREASGNVHLAKLDHQSIVWDCKPIAIHYNQAHLLSLLPKTPKDAHKGSKGHHLLLGGESGKLGALFNAADGAFTCGVGLITCITDPDHLQAVACYQPQYMATSWSDTAAIKKLIHSAQAMTLGPGLGLSPQLKSLMTTLLKQQPTLPLLLDADALNILATTKLKLTQNTVITPHPGEAARLLNITTEVIQEDRFKALHQLIERYQCIVALKGAGTLVGAPNKTPYLCVHGNPGMAVAGSGDLLSGLVGGFLTLGVAPYEATILGVEIHALAADKLQHKQQLRSIDQRSWLKAIRILLNPNK